MTSEKILFFTSETAPSFAGDGRNALLFANKLKEEGVEVSICCLNPGGLLKSVEIIDGIEVNRVKYYHKTSIGKIIARDFITHFLVQKGRSYNCWVIYGAMPGYQLILFFGWWFNKKIIFRSTLFGFDDIRALVVKKPFFVRSFRKWLFSHVDIYFALNSAFENEWKTFINSKRTTVFTSPQGVDTKKFCRVDLTGKMLIRKKLGLPTDKLILLTVGHLTRRKGFPELFSWLSEIKIDFYLVHVGRSRSPDWDALSSRNKEMLTNVKAGKELLGDRFLLVEPLEEINFYYQAADIFLLPSYSEGFPSNATNEAMSTGLPILIRNIPGYQDYVDDGVNSLVFSDQSEFTSKLIGLFEDEKLRDKLGSNARVTALEKLEIRKIAERFIDFLSAK